MSDEILFEGVSDAQDWKNLLKSIGQIIYEGLLEVSKEGFRLIQQNNAGSVLVDLSMNSKSFEKYEFKSETNLEIGLRITEFKNYLDRLEGKIRIAFTQAYVKLSEMTGLKRTFQMRQLDLVKPKEDELSPIHKLSFPNIVKIKSDVFKKVVSDAHLLSRLIEFRISEKNLVVNTKKEEIDRYDSTFNEKHHAISYFSVVKEHESVCRFDIEYILKISNSKEFSDDITLKFGPENHYPMLIEYNKNNILLKYLIMPMVPEGGG